MLALMCSASAKSLCRRVLKRRWTSTRGTIGDSADLISYKGVNTSLSVDRELAELHQCISLQTEFCAKGYIEVKSAALPNMEAQLEEISALPQQRKASAFQALLTTLVASPNAAQLSQFAEVVVSDSVGLVVSKQVLGDLVNALTSIKDRRIQRDAIESVLARLSSRVVSFEEQVSLLRECLAGIQEADEEWSEAAKTLQGIPLESGHRVVSDVYKLQIYVRIVRLLLEDDDATSAESYYNRASLLIHSCNDTATILHFKLAQARIFDSKRKFADASLRFHELSYSLALAEEDRNQCLSAAVKCAILAPAGPARSRILATLFRDDRAAQLDHYTILRKMFLDQIIRPSELTSFEASLSPHQLAKLPPTAGMHFDEVDDEALEGTRQVKKGPANVFDRAMMQHNLLAASRVYSNITFKGLGALVGLTPTAAEAMARTMIQETRLRGQIDQVENLIMFEPRKKVDEGVVSNVAVAGEEKEERDRANIHAATIRWDENIRTTLQQVEGIVEQITPILAQS